MTGRRPVAEHVREACRSLAAAQDAATSDPLTALRHAVDVREEVDMLVRHLAAHARLWHGERGASWTDIGQALAVTRQAAQQRYGADVDQLLRETIRTHRQATLTHGTQATLTPRSEPEPATTGTAPCQDQAETEHLGPACGHGPTAWCTGPVRGKVQHEKCQWSAGRAEQLPAGYGLDDGHQWRCPCPCHGEQSPCPHPDHATADRQATLTPEPAAEPDPRYLLACDLVDGWTLWQLDDSDDGDDQALGTDPDRDETDVAGAQEWATTVLANRGQAVTGWATRRGRLDAASDGWSPLTR